MSSTHDRIYLDNASATPVHPKVARAVYEALEELPGNPSAPHAEGRKAYEAVERAREKIARTLGVKAEELVFTSGGTESNNLALQGVIEGMHARGVPYKDLHIVTTSIEHSSILSTLEILEGRGVSVSYVDPDFDGIVRAESILHALRGETVLVTLAHVNSETGVIQPLSEIKTELTRWKGREVSTFKKIVPETSFPILHVDAAQSPLYLDASPHACGADLVSYDAQKLQGPKGVGVLYRDFSVPLSKIWGGGTQERSVRPGTENVAGIVGAGVAFEIAKEERAKREVRIRELRDYLIEKVRLEVPSAELIGHPKRRIANNALFTIPGVDGDYLAVLMDERGVAVSPRSACIGAGGASSYVVLALTHDEKRAKGTIRFSLGSDTTRIDIERAVTALKSALKIAQSAS
ncbi:MAG: cysteine desulfurase family protein [Patescibacteria group bacterium]